MGQNNDAPQTRAQSDAHALIDRQAQGFSADCLFQNWPKDRQMEAYRELNKIQNPADNIPDLTITFGDNGRHLVSRGGNDNARCAPQDVARTERPREAARQVEKPRRDTSTEVSPRELERLAHPERPAEKIEDLAKMALGGDERARLDLRKELEKLANEPNKEFRDKVLKRMVEDGTYLANPFNGKPHVEVTKDASGKPTGITFSEYLGVKKHEVPLNKSLEEQVTEAQQKYMTSLGMVTGGLGKFDTEATLKAMEIQMGADPTNLRWFMLHRKDQGRPVLDRNN